MENSHRSPRYHPHPHPADYLEDSSSSSEDHQHNPRPRPRRTYGTPTSGIGPKLPCNHTRFHFQNGQDNKKNHNNFFLNKNRVKSWGQTEHEKGGAIRHFLKGPRKARIPKPSFHSGCRKPSRSQVWDRYRKNPHDHFFKKFNRYCHGSPWKWRKSKWLGKWSRFCRENDHRFKDWHWGCTQKPSHGHRHHDTSEESHSHEGHGHKYGMGLVMPPKHQ